MSFLILPINTYYGGLQCIKHGATTPKWRTASFFDIEGEPSGAALYSVEDADKWVNTVDFAGQTSFGSFEIGISFVREITLRFYLPQVFLVPPATEGTVTYTISYQLTNVNGFQSAAVSVELGSLVEGDPAMFFDSVIDIEAIVNETEDFLPIVSYQNPCGWSLLLSFGGIADVTSPENNMSQNEPMTLEIVDVTF